MHEGVGVGLELSAVYNCFMFMFYSIHKLVDSFSTKQMVMQNHLFHLLDGLFSNAPIVMVIVFNTHQMIIMYA